MNPHHIQLAISKKVCSEFSEKRDEIAAEISVVLSDTFTKAGRYDAKLSIPNRQHSSGIEQQ
jgi:hypothetical protein